MNVLPENPLTHNQFAYSVSEIATALKRVVEDHFGLVRVRGEISGWKGAHGSGHAYFRVKDDKAVLEAVCWRGSLSKLGFRPEEGLEVIATGRITTYPGSSKYQIVIESMEPAGIGALMALLEKRKAMLAAEGLFDEKRKKPLPFMPRVIGVVTSPTGAVIRDILHRLNDRFPSHVLVWPVAVQGENAAAQIAAAIAGFNAMAHPTIPSPDLIIVARGGGSLEDIWAFNEEIVVRAAAASRIPLISAVGHETDTTLIDFASDRRAPTPTAAAEMAVSVHADWVFTLHQHEARIAQGLLRLMKARAEALQGLARGLPNPERLLEAATQRFDDWSERLKSSLPALLAKKEQTLAVAQAKLQPKGLAQQLARHTQDITSLAERMGRMALRSISDREQALSHRSGLLESLNPLQVLARGFVMLRDAAGHIVSRAADAAPGKYTIAFHDGTRKAMIEPNG